jgi:hypothetical protein
VPQLRELVLYSGADSTLDLTPLLELRSLEVLRCDSHDGLTQAQARVIKQMAALRELSCNDGQMPSDVLVALCCGQHALRNLSSLDLRAVYLNARDLACCARFPALTTLEPWGIDADALGAGVRFALPPSLTFLCARINDPIYTPLRLSGLVEAMRACGQLTNLLLAFECDARTSGPVLRLILGAVAPKLKSLRVEKMRLADLRCLDSLSALEELHLARLNGVSPARVAVLRMQHPHLHRIVLHSCCVGLTSEFEAALPGCHVAFEEADGKGEVASSFESQSDDGDIEVEEEEDGNEASDEEEEDGTGARTLASEVKLGVQAEGE